MNTQPISTTPPQEAPFVKADDLEQIERYLGRIANLGNPRLDIGEWSDFVNRVRRVARFAQLRRGKGTL